MTQKSKSKAYKCGYSDGADAVAEAEDQSPDTIEGWFAEGKLEPDEGLVNAGNDADRARWLGISVAAVAERGSEWSRALADYNRGYRAGARSKAKQVDETEDQP